MGGVCGYPGLDHYLSYVPKARKRSESNSGRIQDSPLPDMGRPPDERTVETTRRGDPGDRPDTVSDHLRQGEHKIRPNVLPVSRT